MNAKNRYIANILGAKYKITANESIEHLEVVCNEVNEKMENIAKLDDLNPIKVSFMTSINLCDELIKVKKENEILAEKLTLYSEKCEKLQREISILEEEKKYLKNLLTTNNNR